MSKIMNAVRTINKVIIESSIEEEKAKELADKLMRKTYSVDYEQVLKIARVLVSQAEITWK